MAKGRNKELNRFGQQTTREAVGTRAFDVAMKDLQERLGFVLEDSYCAAQSAVCRSELSFLGLDYPRFSFRCHVAVSRERGFFSFRRQAQLSEQLQDLPIATGLLETGANLQPSGPVELLRNDDIERENAVQELSEMLAQSNPLVESVLPLPERLKPLYRAIQRDFTRVFRTSLKCEGTAFASMLEFGGGACWQAVLFMAILHAEYYVDIVRTPAELSREIFSVRNSDGSRSTLIRGLNSDGLRGCIERLAGGLKAHQILSGLPATPTQPEMGRNSRSRMTIEKIIPYIHSGMPAIWCIDASRYSKYVLRNHLPSEMGHALLVCGVSRSDPTSFLVHDPSSGPYIEVSKSHLYDIVWDRRPRNGAISLSTTVLCPERINLHYSGTSRESLTLTGLASSLVSPPDEHLKQIFPRLGPSVETEEMLHPRETVLVDLDCQESPEMIQRVFCHLPSDKFQALTHALFNANCACRYIWLNIFSEAKSTEEPDYYVFAWSAESPVRSDGHLYSNLLFLGILSETSSFEWRDSDKSGAVVPRTSHQHAPQASIYTETLAKAKIPEVFSDLNISLITSFSARALCRTFSHWPDQSIRPELYLFMQLDILPLSRVISRATPHQNTPLALAELIASAEDSQDDLRRIAELISKQLAFRNIPSPVGIATFIPQVSSTIGRKTGLYQRYLRAILKIAILLKEEFDNEALSTVEFVGGSTTSCISLIQRGGQRHLPNSDAYYIRNWEASPSSSASQLAVSLQVALVGIAEKLQDLKLTLASEIEPGDFNLLCNLDRTQEFLDRIDACGLASVVGLNLDIGHAAILRNAAEDKSVFDRKLQQMAPWFAHAHLSDQYLKCHFSDSTFLNGSIDDDFYQLLLMYATSKTLREKSLLPSSGHVSLELEAVDSVQQVRDAIAVTRRLIAARE